MAARKRIKAPAGNGHGGADHTVEFPPLPFALNMKIKVPTMTGEWEGCMADLLLVDVENPRPALAEASAITAFWVFTRAFLRERALMQQDAIKRIEARVKKHLLETPTFDENGSPIRMTKDNIPLWYLNDPDYESALASLRQTERLVDIAENIMWELKTWHKDLQILAAATQQERSLEGSTSASADPGRQRRGSTGYKNAYSLEADLGSELNGEGENDDES